MASGDSVVQVLEAMPPGSSFATMVRRIGGSTPPENALAWAFDAAIDEVIDFLCYLDLRYAGGGVTLLLPWMAASATTGNVIWDVAIRRMADDADDIDVSHTYAYNSVTDATASASGELSYPTVAFTDGADMDNWTAGEMAIVRVRRPGSSNGSDTMAGDAHLWAVLGKET